MKLGLLTAAMLVLATSAMSQHAHQSTPVTETGQAQFAAIAQIVTLLRNTPETDWTKVDIDGLRNHLVDMDNVTTKAVVERSVNGLVVTFGVTGEASISPSIQSMVMAHGPMLQQATGWSVRVARRDDGAMMAIQVTSKEQITQVMGLGFFGLMTLGAHHQQHHLMIAMGQSPH